MLKRVISKSFSHLNKRVYNQKPYHTALSLFSEDKQVAKRQYDKEAIKVRMEPTPQPSQEDPELENYWLNLPTVFERAVGSERAELLDPTLFDDHLVSMMPSVIFINHHHCSLKLWTLNPVLDQASSTQSLLPLEENQNVLLVVWATAGRPTILTTIQLICNSGL